MKNARLNIFLIMGLVFVLIFLSLIQPVAASDIKSISVVMDDNYPPYAFRDGHGELQGITLDQWKLFELKTGIQVNITGMTWSKALESMAQGKFDVIDTISYREERTTILDYAEAYATIVVPIFFQNSISGITNVNSLKGFTVGAKKGDNCINVLRDNGITDIEEYDTAEAVVQAAKDHKLVVFVMGKPPALYYLYKMGIQDDFNYTHSSLYTSNFYRAVKKDNKEMLRTINKGFAKISESEYKAIDEQWFGSKNLNLYEHPLFKIIISIGGTVLVVAMLLFLWNRTLQRMVKQKTSELTEALIARKQVEAEIRTLNTELENRVQQRTAQLEELNSELEESNALLEEEIVKREIIEEEIRNLNNGLEDTVKMRTCQLDMLNSVLEQQNSLLHESQRVAHLGSYVADIKKRDWLCSPELHEVFGIDEAYPHTEESWMKIVHPEWRSKLSNYFLQAARAHQGFDFVYKIIRINDGEERWVHELGKFELDENHKACRLIGIIQDITDRKFAEEKIVYLSLHDQLTGLYNRRFFEEELKRLDVPGNYPLTLVMGDVNGLKLINDSFGHAYGDELLKHVAEVLIEGCRKGDIIAKLGGDEFVLLLPNTDTVETEKILKRVNELAKKKRVGTVEISISFGYETKNSEERDILEILKRAEDYMYKKKLFEGPSIRGKTIQTIIRTLHEKNTREEQHSYRVSELCQKMGEALCLLDGEVQELKNVGLLHDIGKIAIDENILNKPEKLSFDEWEEVKRHPEIGYRILSTANGMAEIAEYVLAHHERWDGLGYPKGLKGEELPLQPRIIAIADAYDAMTSSRSYRDALSNKVAIEELKKNAGTQFDPVLVELFIQKVINPTPNF
ncbi:HD domain-containing phosphohydrolase [Desulfosporosinus meridiei]|uniref:PAS domain S-box/diguanylate cyclase (GGDEF) domain-containing protein n=1 Tax=Desulfosporosinus meridiei (strain ATCC BAA-275 / DSM 13257 / KCTC 12902 / NCIMB 13706 / S10) TaxID=768704 RepID=J7J158_DESMD|nr:HD domain-containing phosphohydrolase [Desulfosporosinus meridiei]AFQ45048.1 PAS domain S-box/diguanylate cyclase (GGDEF) domain-containing protein [Desulfosporosinus meridiei DSM 13257]